MAKVNISVSQPGYMERFRESHPLFKLIVIIGGLCILYFLFIEPEMNLMSSLNNKSSAMTSELDLYNSGLLGKLNQRQEGRNRFGDTRLVEGNVSSILSRCIGDILDRYDIRAPVTPKGGNRIIPGSSPKIQGTSFQVVFDASPDTLADILFEMESTPEIARIGSLKITRPNTGSNLNVVLEVEAWSKGT